MYHHLDQFSEASEVLKLFSTELSKDKYYRCSGLGYLVLTLVELGEWKESESYYSSLAADCSKEPSVATAAYVLSDAADKDGESRKAALYLLQYAEHPSAAAEMNNLDMVVKVVKVLSDGKLVSEAKRFVEKAKKIGGGASKLGRELLLMEGDIAMNSQDWKGAYDIFSRYVEDYKVAGANYEDPFVCRDLGAATLKMARQSHPKPAKLPLDMLLEAEKYYGHSFYLLTNYFNNTRAPGQKPDASLVKDYWVIGLRLQLVRIHAGNAGNEEAFNDIHKFVNEYQVRIREQSDLWSKFLTYWKYALKKMGKDPGEFIKAG